MKSTPDGCRACTPGTHGDNSSGCPTSDCTRCHDRFLQWRPGQTECLPCPLEGVNCLNQSAVDVYPGWYWPGDDDPTPIACTWSTDCAGGTTPGSCAPGSSGTLCTQCEAGFYRSIGTCKACSSSFAAASVGLVVALAFLVLLAARFRGALRPSSPRGGRASWARRLVPVDFSQQLATTLKILLAYSQVNYVFRRYSRVKWPHAFTSFLDALDLSQLIGFEALVGKAVAPIHCALAVSLSYYDRLLLTLLLLPLGSALIFCVAATVHLCIRSQQPWREYLTSAPLFDAHIWLGLLAYPSLCREIFALFSCTPFRTESLLYDDPSVTCYDSTWFGWAAVAICGVVVYCLGMPLAFWLLARQYHGSPHRRRVLLLLNSYREGFWWFEAVDLLRKRASRP